MAKGDEKKRGDQHPSSHRWLGKKAAGGCHGYYATERRKRKKCERDSFFFFIWMDEEAEHIRTIEKCAYLPFSTITYM